MKKPSEMSMQSLVAEIVEIVEDDMDYYLGHSQEDQEEWDEEDRMNIRILNLLKEWVDEKWPKRK